MSKHDEDIDRSFEGRAVLEKLLMASGTLADAEDVAAAFEQAVKDGVPAPVVIQALWDDEPRFEKPSDAARLFGNLLGLYELVASGQKVNLATPGERIKREKATKPEPFGAEGPTDTFVEQAWRWFDDYPKERQRFEHAFENRQDALISWLDDAGLDDAGFGLARHLLGEVFAMLELGGVKVPSLDETMLPKKANLEKLPKALVEWMDDAIFEATSDEATPLPEAQGEKVRDLVARAAAAML